MLIIYPKFPSRISPAVGEAETLAATEASGKPYVSESEPEAYLEDHSTKTSFESAPCVPHSGAGVLAAGHRRRVEKPLDGMAGPAGTLKLLAASSISSWLQGRRECEAMTPSSLTVRTNARWGGDRAAGGVGVRELNPRRHLRLATGVQPCLARR